MGCPNASSDDISDFTGDAVYFRKTRPDFSNHARRNRVPAASDTPGANLPISEGAYKTPYRRSRNRCILGIWSHHKNPRHPPLTPRRPWRQPARRHHRGKLSRLRLILPRTRFATMPIISTFSTVRRPDMTATTGWKPKHASALIFRRNPRVPGYTITRRSLSVRCSPW